MGFPWLSRICLSCLVVVLFTGCSRAEGQHSSESAEALAERPSQYPSLEEMLESSALGYRAPPGMLRDCLGRLTFDMPQSIEWATFFDKDVSDRLLQGRKFSRNVFDRGDVMEFGKVRIGIVGPVDSQLARKVRKNIPSETSYLEESINDSFDRIRELKSVAVPTDVTRSDIAWLEESILAEQRSIKKKKEEFPVADFDIPESYGYSTEFFEANDESLRYSVYFAHVLRGNYVYMFRSQERITPAMSKEQHRQKFVAMLKRFRPRALNEVPTELGVCIPHGFIADDGKTITDIKQSFRWPDAPGVVYTIHTGNVDSRRMKFPPLTAGVRAAVGFFGTPEESEMKKHVTKRIGPRPYKMGGLMSQQGGVALKIHRSGKPTIETYSVFTGYSGWLSVAVLPYILVDMQTFTREQAPELTQNPPPFEQSMGRLESVLKSIRLRPTNPPMPEIVAASKK